MPEQGKFIVIEGSDGSGKGEQSARLIERLKGMGKEVSLFAFPRYGEPSCWFVTEYLNGKFGSKEDVGPRTASLFYAMDRYVAAIDIRAALQKGHIVICDRYVGSNLGHQGAKFNDPDERKKYFEWDLDLEYNVNGIPRPDLNIVLHVPANIAQKLIDQKVQRKYLGDKKRDLHEIDPDYLKRSEEVFNHLTEIFPDNFTKIECAPGNTLLSIGEVHEKVWAAAKPVLGL